MQKIIQQLSEHRLHFPERFGSYELVEWKFEPQKNRYVFSSPLWTPLPNLIFASDFTFLWQSQTVLYMVFSLVLECVCLGVWLWRCVSPCFVFSCYTRISAFFWPSSKLWCILVLSHLILSLCCRTWWQQHFVAVTVGVVVTLAVSLLSIGLWLVWRRQKALGTYAPVGAVGPEQELQPLWS